MKNIADTAYLVAMYRALETERPDSLFKDKYAALLAGSKGAMLVEILGEKEKITNAIALRTRLIDEQIEKLVQSQKIDTVLNLAAGLDTRPYRLDLPNSLHWIEVDFPDIIVEKEQKLQNIIPVCSLERIKLDITDTHLRKNLFSDISKNAKQVLVISEGFLSYLPEIEVAAIASDIKSQSKFIWWLFELESAETLENYDNIYTRKIFDQYFASGNRTLLFAPKQGANFFKQYGWQVTESISAWKESRRLKRDIKITRLLEPLMNLFAKANWEKLQQQGSIILLRNSKV
ncbi:class I SAM-dependent methyltransferase [Brunnivagina elsteri]|uniref:S-adenosyl-L-methionine-dependent methyltransferase n=1 Tax=Brunnivagina elsteri CCALA 953 TaxID=987040 RepID=A0A2A2TL62_9CYAN|nr:SAM-dependent methyltransferase [Calothrix elsteri]PAX57981.1 SAM-dependent methyltransferase [Calothrix elsteri CCALA 953]